MYWTCTFGVATTAMQGLIFACQMESRNLVLTTPRDPYRDGVQVAAMWTAEGGEVRRQTATETLRSSDEGFLLPVKPP